MTFRKLSRALAAALIVGGVYAASPVYAAETAAPAAGTPAAKQATAAAPAAGTPAAKQATAAASAAGTPAAKQTVEVQTPFDVQVVEQHVMATITRFEKDDITGLQAEATAELRPHLTVEQVKGVKTVFAPTWGLRGAVGKPIMTADKEDGKWYVISELAVGYQTTAVVYRLIYDENMKLAGFFVR